jgi:hypothetical protein
MGRLSQLEIFDAGRQLRARVGQPGWHVVSQNAYMPSPRVTVCPATAEEWPVVERLAQLERHDLSQFRGYLPRADGTYAFDKLDLFRAEPGRQAWLIRYGLTLAGFALTRPLESGGTSMYAFFIVRVGVVKCFGPSVVTNVGPGGAVWRSPELWSRSPVGVVS